MAKENKFEILVREVLQELKDDRVNIHEEETEYFSISAALIRKMAFLMESKKGKL